MSIRWAGWRRDLAFAVAGVVVASAVLVPLWLSQVRAERQHADAAEQEAATRHALAEEQARIAREAADLAAARMTDEERALAELAAAGRRENAEYTKFEDVYSPSPFFDRTLAKVLIPDKPAPIPPAPP
jgi:hypothetical protein